MKLSPVNMRPLSSALFLLAVLALSAPYALGQEEAAQKWSLRSGTEVEAHFVRGTEKGVILRKGSKEVEVLFSQLTLESHLQALKLSDPEAFSKPLVKAVVKPVIPEPAFTLDADVLLKNPFPDNPTIDQFLSTLKSETEANNPMVGWFTLPPKMQDDIITLVSKGAEKLGSSTFTQIRSLMGSVNKIAQNHKEYVKNYPLVASQPQAAPAIDEYWPLAAGLIGALADESHWQAENFEKENFVNWMANFAASVTPYATMIGEKVGDNLPPGVNISTSFEYTIKSQTKDRAEVELRVAGQPPQTIKYQKVGNTWIPPQQMNQFRKDFLDKALETVNENKPAFVGQVQAGLTVAGQGIRTVASAESQEEFDGAVGGLQSLVESMIPQGALNNLGPGTPSPL